MTVQIITLAGEEYVVVPRMEYEALREAVDEDASDADLVRRVLDDPGEELAPFEISERIAQGVPAKNECTSEINYPCQYGGTCVDLVGHYECLCTSMYTGINCSERGIV